jgi:hypothetical protein
MIKSWKKFNENIEESIDMHSIQFFSIISDCEDILLELEDNDFECYVYVTKFGYVINVYIASYNEFTYDDIEEYIDRLKSYLLEYGYIGTIKTSNASQSLKHLNIVPVGNKYKRSFWMEFVNE